MSIMDVQLTVSQQMKLRRLIDWAYQMFIEQASPSKPKAQHRLTVVDLNKVEQALAELSEMAPSGDARSNTPHAAAILEMLYRYGVTEAQQELPL